MAKKIDLAFGEIAVKMGLINQDQIKKCLDIQENSSKWIPIGSVILEQGYMSQEQITMVTNIQKRNLEAMAIQKRQISEDNIFGRIALKLGHSTEKQIEECLSEQLSLTKNCQLKLGEIMLKKGYLTKKQLDNIVSYQQKKVIACASCKTKYNVVFYNPGIEFVCWKCENKISVPKEANY